MSRLAALPSKLYLLLALLTTGLAQANPIHHRYFTSSDGVRLHYLEAGKGERTLVFIPGWVMPAAVFEQQLLALSNQFRVLAFDPRSQGLSALTLHRDACGIWTNF